MVTVAEPVEAAADMFTTDTMSASGSCPTGQQSTTGIPLSPNKNDMWKAIGLFNVEVQTEDLSRTHREEETRKQLSDTKRSSTRFLQ